MVAILSCPQCVKTIIGSWITQLPANIIWQRSMPSPMGVVPSAWRTWHQAVCSGDGWCFSVVQSSFPLPWLHKSAPLIPASMNSYAFHLNASLNTGWLDLFSKTSSLSTHMNMLTIYCFIWLNYEYQWIQQLRLSIFFRVASLAWGQSEPGNRMIIAWLPQCQWSNPGRDLNKFQTKHKKELCTGSSLPTHHLTIALYAARDHPGHVSEIGMEIQFFFSLMKMHLKISSAKIVAILSRGRWVNATSL